MIKHLRHHSILIGILILAALLRLYQLGSYPIHLTPDEAALGYNAYSIVKTARDEHGSFLPIVFKSFGDYKPGLYIYLTVPFVAILDLTELSVRLPAALSGIFAVFLIFKLIQLIQPTLHYSIGKFQIHIAHLTALTLAINPWHISFTRGAWESGVALTQSLLIIYLIILSMKQKAIRYLFLAMITAGLSLWTYHGAKLSTILLLLASLIIYGKHFLSIFSYKQLVLAGFTFLLVASPIFIGMFSGQGGRFAVFSIFSYGRSTTNIQTSILEPAQLQQTDLAYKLFFNEPLNFLTSILRRYFRHLTPDFLFFTGDTEHPQLTLPYMGVFHWWDVIGLILGCVFIFKRSTKWSFFIVLWTIFAPLPSSLSRDELNAVRSLPLLLPLTIIIGAGWWNFLKHMSSTSYRIPTYVILIGIYSFSTLYMLDQYFNTAPLKNAQYQYFGYKQVVLATQADRAQGLPLLMSQSYDQPYIYFLFYDKYNPVLYQQSHNFQVNQSGDVGLITQINDQLKFGMINWTLNQQQHNHIFVGDPVTTIHPELSSDPNKFQVTEINYPNQHGRFRIVKVLPK